MYYIEVDKRINQVLNFFHQLGLWRIEEDSSLFRKMARKLKYLIFQVTLFTSVVGGGLISDDKNESVYLITAGIAVLVITVKLTYVLWRNKEILSLIEVIGTHSIEDYEEFVKINEKVKKLVKFSSVLFLVIWVAGGLLTVFSLPAISSEKRLPVSVWFPFDWKNNAIAYWIAYAYVLIGMIINITGAAFDIIIWYLMLNCSIKYQILGNRFRNVFVPKPTINKRKISRDEAENLFLQELVCLIKTHENNKERINRFKSCLGNLFFAQITTSGICICGSVYILAFGANNTTSFQIAVNCALLLYNIFDIFMVMYLGNEIKLSSDRLSYCMFESNWLERSKTCKKFIIILTEVLKQPHVLVMFKLYPLSMETFTTIVKFAYSILNILQNLN